MVKTIEYAKRKWERKTSGKGSKWKERTTAAKSRASDNMAKFVGHPVPEWSSAYSSGVDGVSASDFESAIRGKGEDWAEAMRAIK